MTIQNVFPIDTPENKSSGTMRKNGHLPHSFDSRVVSFVSIFAGAGECFVSRLGRMTLFSDDQNIPC